MTTPYEAALKMPQVGEPAPQFKLASYPYGEVALADYIGKKNVILAFYPKDDTPGCTKEMCSFSVALPEFVARNAEILGVSCDSLDSHATFSQKHELKLILLSDAGGDVSKSYGVLREGRAMANRVLFLIDKLGVIRHVVEGMPSNADLFPILESLT